MQRQRRLDAEGPRESRCCAWCTARALYPESPTSSTPKHEVVAHVVWSIAALTCSLPRGRAGSGRSGNVTRRLRSWPRFWRAGRGDAADGAIFRAWPLTRATSRACWATCRGRGPGAAARSVAGGPAAARALVRRGHRRPRPSRRARPGRHRPRRGRRRRGRRRARRRRAHGRPRRRRAHSRPPRRRVRDRPLRRRVRDRPLRRRARDRPLRRRGRPRARRPARAASQPRDRSLYSRLLPRRPSAKRRSAPARPIRSPAPCDWPARWLRSVSRRRASCSSGSPVVEAPRNGVRQPDPHWLHVSQMSKLAHQ